MGIFDTVKSAVSGDSDGEKKGDVTFEDEFQKEEIEEMEEEAETEPEPEEEVQQEWETAYQFCDEAISEAGFVDLQEFIEKAMIYRIERSTMYRDRIESGIQTMDMITSSMESIHSMRGEFQQEDEGSDYGEYAEQVRAANDLIDEIDRMEGKEEEMAQEVISIAKDAVDAMGETSRNQSRNVDSSMNIVEE